MKIILQRKRLVVAFWTFLNFIAVTISMRDGLLFSISFMLLNNCIPNYILFPWTSWSLGAHLYVNSFTFILYLKQILCKFDFVQIPELSGFLSLILMIHILFVFVILIFCFISNENLTWNLVSKLMISSRFITNFLI